MRLRFFGFAFDKTNAPKGIHPAEIFKSLESRSSLNSDALVRFGITPYKVMNPNTHQKETWWAGIILKVRNARSFTKLTEQGGKSILTSDILAVGDNLVESSFLLANPASGAGLYANHHLAASFNTGFSPVLLEEFRRIQEERIATVMNDTSLTPITKKAMQKLLRGALWPAQLLLPGSFRTQIKELKSVGKVRVRFKGLSSALSVFRSGKALPKSETVEYTMEPGTESKDVAPSLISALDDNALEKVSVYGEDHQGIERRISTSKNPAIFADADYDTIMAGLELDMDNYGPSLVKARVIGELERLTRSKVIWNLLETS